MTWEALGAIGELLGALAVILTLGYLTVQVRQNTKSINVTAKNDIDQQYTAYTDLLLKDTELLELQLRGMAQEKLDRTEYVKYSLLMQRATWSFSSMHRQFSSKSVTDNEWHETDKLIKWFTLAPGYRSWWKKNSSNYSVEFRNYLNHYLDTLDG